MGGATSAALDDSQLAVSRSEYSAMVAQFFQKIGYRPPQPFHNPEIELVLTQYIQQQRWSDGLKARSVKYAKQAVPVAAWNPRASFACQFGAVIISLLVIIYDEENASVGTAGTDFCTRLVRGQPQETPSLESLARFLQDTKPYLGPYGSSMLLKSTIEFLASTKVEKESSEYAPRGATRFPRYLRDRTGFPDVYAHMVFPHDIFPEEQYRKLYLPAIPPLCEVTVLVNDVLSFYKETMRGTERFNYICNLVKATDRSALQCLYDTSDVLEKGIAEVRRILKPHPALLAHANDYLTGYINWHVRTVSRYHLDEVMDILEVGVADTVKPDVLKPV